MQVPFGMGHAATLSMVKQKQMRNQAAESLARMVQIYEQFPSNTVTESLVFAQVLLSHIGIMQQLRTNGSKICDLHLSRKTKSPHTCLKFARRLPSIWLACRYFLRSFSGTAAAASKSSNPPPDPPSSAANVSKLSLKGSKLSDWSSCLAFLLLASSGESGLSAWEACKFDLPAVEAWAKLLCCACLSTCSKVNIMQLQSQDMCPKRKLVLVGTDSSTNMLLCMLPVSVYEGNRWCVLKF